MRTKLLETRHISTTSKLQLVIFETELNICHACTRMHALFGTVTWKTKVIKYDESILC
jgi:hypothetical protein